MILISFKVFFKLIWKYLCKIPLDVYIVIILIIFLILALIQLNIFYRQIKVIVMSFIGADKQRIKLFTDTILNDYEEAYNDLRKADSNDDKIDYDDLDKIE